MTTVGCGRFRRLPTSARGANSAVSQELDLNQQRLVALVGYNLRRASTHVQQRLVEELAPHELSAAEFSVLTLLDANSLVTQRRLCDALAVSPPNMVGLLERLQRRALIERVRDADDRRHWIITLTNNGTRLVRRAEQTVHALEQRLFAGFAGPELTALRGVLQRIYLSHDSAPLS